MCNNDDNMKIYDKVNNIINDCLTTTIYLLSNELEEYKLYKLSITDNQPFLDIISKTIGKIDDTCELFDYSLDIKPDAITSILYLEDKDIPNYDLIKNKIINDESEYISENELVEEYNHIKGYAIKVDYIEDSTQKQLIAFSKLFKSHILTPKTKFFQFNRDKSIMEKVTSTLVQFNEKLLSINIDNTMFVLDKHYFEQLFKYEELINKLSQESLNEIQNTNIISNFDSFKEYCQNNKNLKRKLSNVIKNNCLNQTTYEEFKKLKMKHKENLLFELNESNQKIIVDESKLAKSSLQILRIYNDETATTLLTNTSIFASEKIPI